MDFKNLILYVNLYIILMCCIYYFNVVNFVVRLNKYFMIL